MEKMKGIRISKRIFLYVFVLSIVICGVLARPIDVYAAGRNYPNISDISGVTDDDIEWIVFETSDPLYTYRLVKYPYEESGICGAFCNAVTPDGEKIYYKMINVGGGKTKSVPWLQYNSESGKWASGGSAAYGGASSSLDRYSGYSDNYAFLKDVTKIVGSSKDIYSIWPDNTSKLFFPATRQTLETTLPMIDLTGIMREIVGLIPLLVVLVVLCLGLKKSFWWLLTALRRS